MTDILTNGIEKLKLEMIKSFDDCLAKKDFHAAIILISAMREIENDDLSGAQSILYQWDVE